PSLTRQSFVLPTQSLSLCHPCPLPPPACPAPLLAVLPFIPPISKSYLIKPTSLMYGLPGRADDTVSLHSLTSNGGNRIYEGGTAEVVSGSPILMKEIHHMEKSPSLGEINNFSESSRSFSPNSTEPDTPSPTGGQIGVVGAKGSSRIPQLTTKKSLLEEDSGSTGEDTDPTFIRKKHPFKIFKKQKK
ncbi:hypothetical protein XENOCAPTIV_003169, partial [Xenoophorus captivus]